MSFLRRNQGDKKGEQAVPAESTVPSPAVKKEAKASGGGGGLFGGIRQWIVDSYNGLYKIVLEPSMPTKQTVILLVFGVLVGLIWGYGLKPTEFYGGNPNRLNESSQRLWIRAIAMAYHPVERYDEATAQSLLSVIPDPSGKINTMLSDGTVTDGREQAALQLLQQNIAPNITNPAQPIVVPSLFVQAIDWLFPLILIAILTPICVLLWRLLIQPNIAAPMVDRVRRMTDKKYDEQRRKEIENLAQIRQQEAERRALKEKMAQEAPSELGAPVKTSVFIYSKGRSFDESVEIELASGEFLGQCGAVIAEAVDPDPTAIEVWLFDMTTQKQINKVFVTEQAFANPSTKAALEDSVDDPANDIMVAAPGAKLFLDTVGLRLQGEMATLEVGPDGKFVTFKMTVQAWQKKGGATPAPVAAKPTVAPLTPPPLPAAKPLPTYDDLTFDPPPAAPKPLTPPPLPAAKPLPTYDDLTFDPPPMPPAPKPAARPLAEYDNLTFDPPPAPPAPKPLTPLGGVSPLKPPAPPSAPGFDDDDPFGGTGDFTPLSSGN